MEDKVLYWALLLLSAVMNSYGAFLIKLNLNRQGPLFLESVLGVASYVVGMIKRPQFFIGFAFWAVSPLLFALSLSRIELTIGQPVFIICNFMLIFFNGVVFLGERITRQKTVAMMLSVASIIFFSID